MEHNLEKNVKRWLKRKISITIAIITIFAIAGNVGFADEIASFSSITAEKTGRYGSSSMEALKKNLQDIDASVNKNLGYEKITVLETWSKVKDYATTAIGGFPGLMALAGDAEKQEAVIKSRIKDAVKKRVETLYGKNFETNEKFKKDLEEAKALPTKSHTAIADLSNYLPKVLDKADEVVSEVKKNAEKDKEHDTKIRENTESIDENVLDISNNKGAIEMEVARSTEKDKEHDSKIQENADNIDENVLDISNNKGAIEMEVARSTEKDKEHDSKIQENADNIDENVIDISNNKGAIEMEVARSTEKDKEHDSKIRENMDSIDENVIDISNNKGAIEMEVTRSTEKDKEHDSKIRENKQNIESNRASIEHLDKKVNKGTAMLVAMANVDFQNLNEGEIGIGAGVGSYSGEQAVAVGIAYAVNEDMKLHAKWSGVAGDPHYNAIGGGVSYKFRAR